MEKYVSSAESVKLIDWVVNKLSEEEKDCSSAQITNAWVMGLPVQEAPAYEPEGYDEYTDYWDEVNLIVKDWVGVSIEGGRNE